MGWVDIIAELLAQAGVSALSAWLLMFGLAGVGLPFGFLSLLLVIYGVIVFTRAVLWPWLAS